MTTKQDQWDQLAGHLIGYQATWVIDIGLEAGLLALVATAPDGIGEDDVVTHPGSMIGTCGGGAAAPTPSRSSALSWGGTSREGQARTSWRRKRT